MLSSLTHSFGAAGRTELFFLKENATNFSFSQDEHLSLKKPLAGIPNAGGRVNRRLGYVRLSLLLNGPRKIVDIDWLSTKERPQGLEIQEIYRSSGKLPLVQL